MFSIGDVVVYTTYGICKITDIVERSFGGQVNPFYTLVPLSESKTMLSIPVNNPMTASRLHCLLSEKEIQTILLEIPFIEPIWIENDNQRKREFGEVIKNGNRKEILQILKSIRLHASTLKNKGRKLHAVDEQNMKDAEKLIVDEFSYVLQKDKLDIRALLFEKLDQ